MSVQGFGQPNPQKPFLSTQVAFVHTFRLLQRERANSLENDEGL